MLYPSRKRIHRSFPANTPPEKDQTCLDAHAPFPPELRPALPTSASDFDEPFDLPKYGRSVALSPANQVDDFPPNLKKVYDRREIITLSRSRYGTLVPSSGKSKGSSKSLALVGNGGRSSGGKGGRAHGGRDRSGLPCGVFVGMNDELIFVFAVDTPVDRNYLHFLTHYFVVYSSRLGWTAVDGRRCVV